MVRGASPSEQTQREEYASHDDGACTDERKERRTGEWEEMFEGGDKEGKERREGARGGGGGWRGEGGRREEEGRTHAEWRVLSEPVALLLQDWAGGHIQTITAQPHQGTRVKMRMCTVCVCACVCSDTAFECACTLQHNRAVAARRNEVDEGGMVENTRKKTKLEEERGRES